MHDYKNLTSKLTDIKPTSAALGTTSFASTQPVAVSWYGTLDDQRNHKYAMSLSSCLSLNQTILSFEARNPLKNTRYVLRSPSSHSFIQLPHRSILAIFILLQRYAPILNLWYFPV